MGTIRHGLLWLMGSNVQGGLAVHHSSSLLEVFGRDPEDECEAASRPIKNVSHVRTDSSVRSLPPKITPRVDGDARIPRQQARPCRSATSGMASGPNWRFGPSPPPPEVG